MYHNQNVARLKPRVPVQRILNPDAILYVVNCGDGKGDGTGLSDLGVRQSQRVSVNFDVARIQFNLVICPANLLAQQTAAHVLHHHRPTARPIFEGCEFHSPRDKEDASALRDLVELSKAKRSIQLLPKDGPKTIYGLCNHELRETPSNVFDRFKNEIRRDALAIPEIGGAQRIGFFCDDIVGNIVTEVLFPQFAAKLEMIELEPGDILRVTMNECKHIPLLT